MSTFVRSRRALLASAVTSCIPSFGSPSVPDTQALVCIFLLGGNDSNNMIVPMEPGAWHSYARGRGGLALNRHSLLPVRSDRQNGIFGFHPSMPGIASLYRHGHLAVIANAGRPQRTPSSPLSHTASGNARFLPPGMLAVPWLERTQVFGFGGVTLSPANRIAVAGPSLDNPALTSIVASASLHTPFPRTVIGQQLLRAARILKRTTRLGVARPVITCSMSGWDTHGNALLRQQRLLADLSAAMAAFYRATEEMGIADHVVTYTSSEFNRRLAPNSSGGAEHAWGGHELVMGASVRGGEIYGRFPSLALGGPDDAADNGTWIPSVSSADVDAELARWWGLELGDIPKSDRDFNCFRKSTLGFLS